MENVYKTCLAFELRKRGLEVQTEVPCPVIYEGLKIDGGYRIDLIVERCVVVELKAVDRILEVHDAQLLSYLRLSGHKLGLRINFNVVHLKDGIKRMVNGF
jgi:GxxExxY protein